MIDVSELHVPVSVDSPDAADFIGMVDVRNAVTIETMGVDAAMLPRELLPRFAEDGAAPKICYLARIDGRVVGRALLFLPRDPDAPDVTGAIEVHPEFRRRRVGSALLERSLDRLRSDGRSVLQLSSFESPRDDVPTVSPSNGIGSIPSTGANATFAIDHGFDLAQVVRKSELDLPFPAEAVETLWRESLTKAEGYTLVAWVGHTPAELLDDVAALRTRMSTDAPSGDLTVSEDIWDADRVRAYDSEWIESGQDVLIAAARHDASGRLVAFNELTAPGPGRSIARQQDTLVLREHRGHRLGMLTKIRNLRQLTDFAPHTRVVVALNAEENVPMLAINVQLGFRASSYMAMWRLDL